MAYPSGHATFAAVAELVLILQDQLDTAWTLETMAERAGFAPHHLAHAFREHVGAPPLAYLRRLRLERAAYQLVSSDLALEDIAEAAGYASAGAFHRAFARQFGRAPSHVRRGESSARGRPPRQHDATLALPATLGAPEVVEVGPLHGRSLRVPSVDVRALGAAYIQFVGLVAPPTTPWQRGIASPPQGWATRSASREFRCVALADAPARDIAAPLEPWRMRRCWAARFPFAGNSWEIPAAFEWIFDEWLPASGLRFAFDPTLTLFDEVSATAQPGAPVTARIHIPVVELSV